MMMKPPFAVEIKLKLDRNDLSWGARLEMFQVTEGARRVIKLINTEIDNRSHKTNSPFFLHSRENVF